MPGKLTTAFLVLKMALGGEFACGVLPLDEILAGSRRGVPAGLLIHEGQLTYRDLASRSASTSASGGCSRPGCRCRSASTLSRRDLGDEPRARSRPSCASRSTLALAHRDEALEYALGFGRGIDTERGAASSACT